MFSSDKNVLLITATRIKAGKVSSGKNPKLKQTVEFEWNWQNLTSTFVEVKKKMGDNFRIAVDESFVYVTSFMIPNAPGKEREVVQNTAAEIIPENVQQMIWDFKDISPHLIEVPSGQKLVQFVGGTQAFFNRLLQSLQEADLHYEAIEPLSFSVARLVSSYNEPLLVVTMNQLPTLTLIDDSCVITTETIPKLEKKYIDQFISFNKDKVHITPSQIFFTGNLNGVSPQEYQTEQVQVGILEADPMVGAALKNDIKGNDNQVLNLDLTSLKKGAAVLPTETPSADGKVTPTPPQKKNSPFLYIILFFVWLVIVAGIGVVFQQLYPLFK
jgi:hypothetical protein